MIQIRTTFVHTFTFLVACLVSSQGTAGLVRTPGVVDGIETKNKDGVVDAALIIPTLAASDIFSFDFEKLLGPNEPAKAGPISADVPGNTYIPTQREKYGWITVTLEKSEFGLYTRPGEQNELTALWFSAPWDLLIEASKGDANPAALLKSAKFRKAGFAGLKDWSRETKINLSLDRELRPLGQVSWNRSAAPTGYGDMVVAFQNTPAGRWALSSFNGNPSGTVTISSVDMLPPRLKVLGVRSKFDKGTVIAAEGWIVDADRRSKIQFSGVPAALKGTGIQGRKAIWHNPGGPGWMAIIHQPDRDRKTDSSPSFFDGLFPITRLFPTATPETTITWVSPEAEEAVLPSYYQKGDRVMLALIGTSKPVPAPREDQSEPELFTYAQSIRSVVVK